MKLSYVHIFLNDRHFIAYCPSRVCRCIFGYCKYPYCLSYVCLSVCKCDFCKTALSYFSVTWGVSCYCGLVVRNFPPYPLVSIKFNKNGHFWPVHQLSIARICNWKRGKSTRITRFIHLWWIFWPDNCCSQVKNVGADRFGVEIPMNFAVLDQVARWHYHLCMVTDNKGAYSNVIAYWLKLTVNVYSFQFCGFSYMLLESLIKII